MCGIVGYVGKKDSALNILIDSLKHLEYRGYDSAGVAYILNNSVKIVKEKGKISELENIIDYTDKSNMGIAHTRWATHGIPDYINSHPHKCGKITIVHNGIIENYIELKKGLEDKGYIFKSETDTEVGCALLDFYYSETNDILASITKFKNSVTGSYALGIICDDDPNNIYGVRKDNPLLIAYGENENFIASDIPAILKYTNKYSLLEDKEIAVIGENSCTIYSEELNVIKKDILTFEGAYENAIKAGYPHFMLKEIHEEAEVMKKTALNIKNEMIDFKNYNRFEIVACGSAYHAGLIGKEIIENIADIPTNVSVASEFRYKKQFYDSNTLVIVISQSGETRDSIASLRKAKEANIDTLAIVNVLGSTIAREAKHVMYTKAGPEIAVATTKAYSAQVLTLILIALNISGNDIADSKIDILQNMMISLLSKNYKDIAKKMSEKDHIFYIGRGIDYALSMEGSLKLKEISYIHSEAYAAGELKHGTISLIEDMTPVISIITNESLKEKTISNIKEVKARGAYVILITTERLKSDDEYYDDIILIPDIDECLIPVLAIIPLQLLAYETAVFRECDIDKPRNLAKSVTVE